MKNPFYIIVRFELKEGEIDVLFPIIQEFFKTEVSKVSGFISAKFHRNEDGSVLINYATWESAEKFLKFKNEIAQFSETSKKIQGFTSKADVVYEIAL